MYLQCDIGCDGVERYTIASSPSWRDRVEITVKREDHGLVSRWLHDEVKPGEHIRVEAPGGTFGFSGKEAPSVVLIGGGVGITPMMSIARYLTDTNWPGTIYMLLGFLSPRDYIFEREIESLKARNPMLHVAVTVTDTAGTNWHGATGFVDARLISATVPDIVLHRVHVCGPPPMMDAVRKTLDSLGVPQDQVKTEAFGTDKRDPTRHSDKLGKAIAEIDFLSSGVSATAREGMSLLEVAEEAHVHIENACRSGSCGNCMVKLKSGKVHMAVDDALSADEKEEGYILTCQAEPEGAVALEA